MEGGGFTSSSAGRFRRVIGGSKGLERSVVVKSSGRGGEDVGTSDGRGRERFEEEVEASKRWVGFDDEMVIVLKESGRGTQALMVYDFT